MIPFSPEDKKPVSIPWKDMGKIHKQYTNKYHYECLEAFYEPILGKGWAKIYNKRVQERKEQTWLLLGLS